MLGISTSSRGKKFKKDAKLPRPADFESFERNRWLDNTFQKYNTYWRDEIARAVRNARFFWGVNFGQWPDNIVQRLLDQGRRPPTYNVTMDKMETLLGSIMGAGYNVRYEPLYGKMNTMVSRCDDIRMTDYNNLDYKYVETMTFLDALIMVGYSRLSITDKLHDLGNIGLERLNPRRTLLDPRWISDDIDDLTNYYTYYYLTPGEVVEMCTEDVGDQLKELYRREMADGIDFGYYEGFTTYDDPGAKWIDRHLVEEFHWTESQKVWWEYDKKNFCLFPETGFKYGSEEDKRVKAEYAQRNGLTADDIVWDKKRIVTKYIQRVAPTISRELFLANGKDRVQCGGVNLFPLGWRYEGQFQGIVDRMYDLQMSINRGEMSMDSVIATSAKETVMIDEGLAGGDPVKKAQIEDAWNMDGARIWVEEGAMADLGPTGGIVPLPHGQVGADVFRLVDRRYDLADRFAKVPAAQESRSEGASEPNILFENKLAVANLGQWMYNELQRRDTIKRAMAYIRQAKVTYAGAPREFRDTNDAPFTINRQVIGQDGSEYTLDAISQIPEMRVIAVQNKNSESIRLKNQSVAAQLLPHVSADPNDRLLRLCLLDTTLQGAPLPDDKKEEIDKALALLKTQSAMMVAASVSGMRATMQQAAAQEMGGQLPPPEQGEGDEEVPQQQFSKGKATPDQVVAGTPKQAIAL